MFVTQTPGLLNRLGCNLYLIIWLHVGYLFYPEKINISSRVSNNLILCRYKYKYNAIQFISCELGTSSDHTSYEYTIWLENLQETPNNASYHPSVEWSHRNFDPFLIPFLHCKAKLHAKCLLSRTKAWMLLGEWVSQMRLSFIKVDW